MRKQTAIASATALLLCGVATASAATAIHPSDSISLSAAQRKTVWNDLNRQATNQNAAGFNATIGTFVPQPGRVWNHEQVPEH